jgi:hypothetical protein
MIANYVYLTDQVSNLLGLRKSTTGSIANGPTGFLFGFEFTVLKQVNERGNQICVNDRLDLVAVSSSDIGDCPASFFANGLFRAGEKTQQGRKGTTVNDDLGLNVVACDDVTNGAQSRSFNLMSDK